jgi:hypothetical protein
VGLYVKISTDRPLAEAKEILIRGTNWIGDAIPRVNVREIATKPDTSPLIQVICIGFLVEMFRVSSLSIPQHIMERVTYKGPRKLS